MTPENHRKRVTQVVEDVLEREKRYRETMKSTLAHFGGTTKPAPPGLDECVISADSQLEPEDEAQPNWGPKSGLWDVEGDDGEISVALWVVRDPDDRGSCKESVHISLTLAQAEYLADWLKLRVQEQVLISRSLK